ncbi:MAG: hypothetical protein R3228_14580, partial [Halioglobus sp.]|nr:hypothetical protein [Halioglobus sp.]
TTPLIKVKRLAYVRVSAPDLDRAEKFLDEFGLKVASRQGDTIYLRGSDPLPPCYVLTRGASAVTAIAFEADELADLEKIAALDGSSAIEALDGPAGGQVVRLADPMGMQVEIVHGQAPLDAIDGALPHRFNMDGERHREGELPAVPRGPSRVKRLGHLVLESGDPLTVYQWYNQHFGLRKSDGVHLPDGDAMMIFSCLDRGSEFVDHHVVGFQFAVDEGARVQHMAFEVGNFDDLMGGHEHLKRSRYRHIWGIGRHLLGGQIFDYWANPWGVIHEHWTDTDLVNEDHVPGDIQPSELEEYWGPEPSPRFLVSRWNFKTVRNLLRLLKARKAA